MSDLLTALAPLIGLQLLATVAAVFVYLHAPGRGVVKLLVVPLALAALLVSPMLLATMLGYAVAVDLPARFVYLAHQPVVKGGRKVALEVWLRQDGTTRLVRVPWTKELEQALQQAAQGSRGGARARIERRRGDGRDSPDGGYELKLELPEDIPKEAPAAPAPPAEKDPERFSI